MPQLLADAVQQSLPSGEGGGADAWPVERVHWLECFTGKERTSEFCEATDPTGNLESNSSSGHKEYQDRLRAIALRTEGKEKGEIAAALGRSAKFVQTWWKKAPKEVPKPPGVHEYLKTEFWRDIEIVRGFGKGLGIYEEVVPSAEWLQPMADGAAFNKGGYRLKYDKEGRMRPQGNQHAKDGLVPGKHPKLDKLAQKLLVAQNIDDRVLKRPGVLWYPDGGADAIEHRHEAWTALMSFGAPRILTIDKHPVLLRDGDLIVFGTQRHGVPKMHSDDGTFDDYGGRISVVFFFMPSGQQAQGAEPWRAISDGEAPSRKATAMLRDADLGAAAQLQGLRTGAKAADLAQLEALGFSGEEAAAALKAAGFEVQRAADVLLSGGGPALMMGLHDESADASQGLLHRPGNFDRRQQISALYARLGALQASRAASSSACSAAATLEDDAALALRLQQEETGAGSIREGGCGGESADWEEMAILEQLQELEREEDTAGGGREALQSQFAAYEEMLDANDAEEWDGRGDLMVREWRRAHLHIEQQDPSTLYALGCGTLREQVFFELLSMHSIRVLYDFRANPDAAIGKHFSVRSLELACKARGILYRHIPLGRETAYGILKHLREDEGRNSLAELVWHARRKRTALLGAEEDWRIDHRLAIAMRLRQAGHRVLHIRPDGGEEEHPEEIEVPEHLAGEEARLRMLEKQRLAGELKRPSKSATSRSSEVVAQRLTRPQEEIDAGAELRKADTQAELCRIQRRLADLQRRHDDSSDAKAGLGPKLLHVNKFVKAQAAEQRTNLAAGKTKDGKDKEKMAAGGPPPAYSWTSNGGTSGGNPDFASAALRPFLADPAESASGPSCGVAELETLMVECLGCGATLPWDALQEGDGRCAECQQRTDESEAATESLAADLETAPAAEAAAAVAAERFASQPQSSSTWRSRRRAERIANRDS